jgi:DNA-binding transcriptional LysR family regulator
MHTNLAIDLLRSFVEIVDAGSMSKASEQICVSQSALSLQMKRLADLVQTPIFHRHYRGVFLTPEGKTLLAYARAMLALNDKAICSLSGEAVTGPIRVGMIQDFADTLLSTVLVHFARLNPGAQLQVRVGSSSELVIQMAGGIHDLVLCLGDSDDLTSVTKVPMRWLGDIALCDKPLLPIVLMEKPCVFRDAALASLEHSGRGYKIMLETPNISVLRAAVDGGLGLTCRTESFLEAELVPAEALNLPLPRVGYILRCAPAANRSILRFATLIRNAVLDLAGSTGFNI